MPKTLTQAAVKAKVCSVVPARWKRQRREILAILKSSGCMITYEVRGEILQVVGRRNGNVPVWKRLDDTLSRLQERQRKEAKKET